MLCKTLFVLLAAGAMLAAYGFTMQKDGFMTAPPRPKFTQEDMAKVMQKTMEVAKPGPFHRWMEYFLGDWEVETKISWPGAPAPMVTKGSASTSWFLEGRWLTTEVHDERGGMTITQRGVLGYDNNKRKFVRMIVDTASTAMYTTSGHLSSDGKTLTEFGTMDEPGTGEIDKVFQAVTRLVDADHYVIEIHDMVLDEGQTKVVEYAYSRKK